MDEFELPDQGDNIIRAPDFDYEPNEGGIGVEFFLNMQKFKHRTAQICGESGERDTYGMLLKRCIRTAIHMRSRGVKSGDIVALCSYNHLNSCVPYIATLFLGAKIAALDPTISPEDTKHLVSQVKPKMVFIVPESKEMYEEVFIDLSLKCEIVVFDSPGDVQLNPFSEFLKSTLEENDFMPEKVASIFDTTIIFFSSGTTGLAKGIEINHYNIMCQGWIFSSSGFTNTVTLSYATMYWISAAVILCQAVLTGQGRLLCRSFKPEMTWRDIEKFKVNLMFIAPGQAMAMLKCGRPENLNTTSLYDVIVGGGPLSSENMLAFRDLLPGTNASLVYGQTEVAGILTMFKPKIRKDVMLLFDRPSSSGRVIPGIWYKICDLETDQVLGPNCTGELRVKTKLQLNGYHNISSGGIWDEDGWLKTGDICYYDEGHCFFIVDRIKELMKYQSWHVPPALLEGILQEHPAVQLAVVFGVPHEEDGDHPIAVVVKSQTAGDVTEEELVKFVNGRVGERQKLRAGVRFVDSVPHTPSGKIKRKLLKEMILKEIELGR